MIARLEGQVVLVGGAIPGERVTARIERIGKGVAYADTVTVDDPSDDRRDVSADPLCGGCLYAHIAYDRQLEIKKQVVADAFGRIGHLALPSSFTIEPSRIDGYRMRARLHVRDGRIGFFREGTHTLCEPRITRQLLEESCDILEGLAAALRSLDLRDVHEAELSENVDASERVVHLDAAAPIEQRNFSALGSGLTGLTLGPHVLAGDPHVHDRLAIGDREMTWRRHVLTFFQGNRHLLRAFVEHVTATVGRARSVIDLYAGAGLFTLPLAVVGGAHVIAVEGDGRSAEDLRANAAGAGADVAIEPVHQAVERFVLGARQSDVVLVDPPRTGMSRDALDGVSRIAAGRLVYVSCDPPTLARDAKRLVESGYKLEAAHGFDMFPNAPHVEVVAVFTR
jgi:23S rRNA (uracil1939-C5)-methyltransferase